MIDNHINKKITPVISTLIAEIKIIKIGNKQMTQAVFNQLYEKRFYDNDYNIKHELWGKVNFKDEEWIIFQVGDNLRRCKLPYLNDEIISFNEYIIHVLPRLVDDENGKWNHYTKWNEGRRKLPLERFKSYVDGVMWYDLYRKEKTEQQIINIVQSCFGSIDMKELEQDYFIDKQIREKRKELYQKLIGLDQLFIAV